MRTEVRSHEFNILVVEDDENTFKIIKDSLTNTEYKLYRVTTGQEALKMAKESFCIAIITELRIRDMNGIELIRRFKKINPKVNIIVLTAYSFTDSAVEALKEGAYAYLMKPLNIKEISLILRRAIENTFLLVQAGQRRYYQDISAVDGLTSVYNHRHFHEMMDWNIAHLKRLPQAFSLFIIDIDDFKKYNDTHGHVEGDKVLHNTAQLFVTATRDSDMIFRYGGEEFAIILSQTEQKNAQKLGERLLETVRSQTPVRISIGLATFPTNAQTKNDLIKRADKALYRAKETGKDRLCVYDQNIDK